MVEFAAVDRQGPAGDAPLAVAGVSYLLELAQVVGDLGLVERGDLRHDTGLRETLQPQAVSHPKAGFGNVAHRRNPTSGPLGAVR
ncbi:MAG: hypothetical protein NVSMB16_06970 [Acidimicrobiales bacterium]